MYIKIYTQCVCALIITIHQVHGIFPGLDIVKGIREFRHNIRENIRQRIRERTCEFLRNGQVYIEPCGGGGGGGGGGTYGPSGGGGGGYGPGHGGGRPQVKEEVTIIEEYRPVPPHHGGGGGHHHKSGHGGRGHGYAPPQPQPKEEEPDYRKPPQQQLNYGGGGGFVGGQGQGQGGQGGKSGGYIRPVNPVYDEERRNQEGGGGGGNYNERPQQRPPQQQHRPHKDYQVSPEKVAEEMDPDETIIEEEEVPRESKNRNKKLPLPGGSRPGSGGGGGGRGKQGRQQQRPNQQKPQPKPKPQQPQQNKNNNNLEPCQTNNGVPGFCMPATFCYAQHGSVEEYRNNICDLADDGGSGVCCPKEEQVLEDVFDLPIRVPQHVKPTTSIRFISLEDINDAAKEAQRVINLYIEQERRLIAQGMVQRPGSMQMMHQAFFGEFDPEQFKLTEGGAISLVTTIFIKNKFKLSKIEARDGLYKYSLENTDLERHCIQEPDCTQSKYRTIDGSCNNLRRPLWGRSNTAFERLLAPEYNDGLHEPRTKSVTGSQLPSARWISSQAATARHQPDPKYTLMLMQWGQFIDHDLTLASSTRAVTGQGLVCCNERTQKPIEHTACFPITIPPEDAFYRRFNQRCMHLLRNSPSPRSGCSLGHREQMNTLTHLIDASMVYGSTQKRMKKLRTFQLGKLKTSSIHRTEFLPTDRTNGSSGEECSIDQREQMRFKCFLAGDVRVNEQTGLTMMHNLLVREHNRIVAELHRLNPRWNDEMLFQETRRIVAAMIQHITYNEWFPIVLGRKVMKLFNILPRSFGFTKDYNPRVNPNVLNEFATAAYRFHSLIQGTFMLLDNDGAVKHRLKLSHLFNNPKSIYMPNAFDQYLNGFTTEPSESFDPFFTDEITNHLFEESNTGFGMDLVALNIQRGRDHGLPGYNAYRKACGLSAVRSFDELKEVMSQESVRIFARLYQHVDDIDLFIGGSHELPLPDALIGPTFACIVGEQARRNKIGDRFWYENGGLPQSFKPNQLNEIRKASLAGLICDNADSIEHVQPLAFLRPGGFNAKVPCSRIAHMNLNAWKNEKVWQ